MAPTKPDQHEQLVAGIDAGMNPFRPHRGTAGNQSNGELGRGNGDIREENSVDGFSRSSLHRSGPLRSRAHPGVSSLIPRTISAPDRSHESRVSRYRRDTNPYQVKHHGPEFPRAAGFRLSIKQ